MITPRENVKRAINFETPLYLPHDLPFGYGTNLSGVGMTPSPDGRPASGNGRDEWGALWENIGVCQLGEVKEYPLLDWADWDKMNIPDYKDPSRYATLQEQKDAGGDNFIYGFGLSIYERVHFIRGLEDCWADIYEEPEKLCELIDLLADMNCYAIEQFAKVNVDGYIFCDDWGLQERLMIDPRKWREIWMPRYERIYAKAHEHGMLTFLHSCGYIVDILNDLIAVGLNVVHMDQQENMGLELLGERFGGRLTFFSPVDIQTAMHRGEDEIRAYARQMGKHLARPEGGFIPRWYTDPAGAGHSEEAIKIMCDEFQKISRDMYGNEGW